jgi:drug/metabolite transporter (DMT)-like permease
VPVRSPGILRRQASDVPSDVPAGVPSDVPAGHAGYLPITAAATTVLLWAAAFVAIRHVGTAFSPGALSLGRLVVGSLVLGAFMLVRRPAWPPRAMWPRLVVVGVLWFGVYNIALNAGEQRVDAGTAAMVVNVGPILLAVLAGAFLGEGFPRSLLVGSAVAFVGVVVIGLATSVDASADGVGVLLCVVAAVAYAVAVVAQKPLLTRLPALQVTWLAATIGAVSCLPFGPSLVREAAAAPPSMLAWVVFLGAFPTALAFTTWAYALSRTSAGRMGRRPTSSRRSPSCSAGSCSARLRPRSPWPVASCAWSACPSPAAHLAARSPWSAPPASSDLRGAGSAVGRRPSRVFPHGL